MNEQLKYLQALTRGCEVLQKEAERFLLHRKGELKHLKATGYASLTYSELPEEVREAAIKLSDAEADLSDILERIQEEC